MYHIGTWYYLLTAEGGTNFNHMVTAARSKSLWGPYESCPHNPVLSNVHDTSKEVLCAGYGDLFQDHLGSWWMVHLAIRLSRRTMSHLGRETFLTPVRWQEGWPVTDHDRKARLACEVSGRCFTGTVIGLYAGACRETAAVMRVRLFGSRAGEETVS